VYQNVQARDILKIPLKKLVKNAMNPVKRVTAHKSVIA
jgi:hypothetical protein